MPVSLLRLPALQAIIAIPFLVGFTLLPLPALLCTAAIGAMALRELILNKPLDLGHGADVE